MSLETLLGTVIMLDFDYADDMYAGQARLLFQQVRRLRLLPVFRQLSHFLRFQFMLNIMMRIDYKSRIILNTLGIVPLSFAMLCSNLMTLTSMKAIWH